MTIDPKYQWPKQEGFVVEKREEEEEEEEANARTSWAIIC